MTVQCAPSRQAPMTPVPPLTAENQANFILSLFLLRWGSGILENFGVPRMSEAGAIVMLAGLAILFLHRMRIASNVSWFAAGILAWVISGTLSYIANPTADPQATIALLTLLLLYGLFANASATYLQNRSSLPNLSRILTVFVVAGLGLSLAQLLSGGGFIDPGKEEIQRAFGSDVHPVSFAIQTVAALTALEIIRLKQGRHLAFFHVAVMVIGALSIYLTFARTAWVMALIVVALAMILRGSLARRLFIGAAAGGVAIAMFLSSDRFADLDSLPFFLSNFQFDAVFDWRYVDNSVSWRIVNWTYGLQQALEQPWLGFGPGQSAVSSYFNLEMHNVFLEVFFEGGVVGLSALLLATFGLIRLHLALPARTLTDVRCRILANGFGFALLLAVTFSTSFVDQLMSFLLYLFVVSAASIPDHS